MLLALMNLKALITTPGGYMKDSYKTLLLASMLSLITITGVQAHGVRAYYPHAEIEQTDAADKNHEYLKVEETRRISQATTSGHQVMAPNINGYTEESRNRISSERVSVTKSDR